ncbi:MAG: AMP-binding protein [Deltaproteobacteria bacterium]|nr:AMP-binding protein [Deltaproteobacteria bacterium]
MMASPLFPHDTVDGCIEVHAHRAPDAVALRLRENGQWRTYRRAECFDLIERYAALFAERFDAGTLLLFIKRLDGDLLAAYLGAMRAGLVPAQLSPPTAKTSAGEYARKIAHVLAMTAAGGVFTDHDMASRVPEDVTKVTPADAPARSRGARRAHSTALVQFSSGSTGLQKGVALTHDAILAHMRSYADALRLSSDDRLATWLPLYHDMGLIACFLMPLMAGVVFDQMDPFDWLLRPDLLLETIESNRSTLCFLPNFAFHVLAKKGKPRDLGSMRAFVNCSEPARFDTHAVFRQAFPSVANGSLTVCYALAENTFAVSQTPPGAEPRRITVGGKELLSCGSIVAETECRILEPDADGIGEIGIRGAALFAGYLGGDAPMEGEYYRTGDLGCITPEGELFVTGRKKDLVICNGKNLYPQDVEHVASQVAGVYAGRVVAFGVDNVEVGSEELIVIVERDGSVGDVPLKLAVQRAVEAEVGVLPRRVEVVEHMRLVKTSSGKISRSRNRELYLAARGE